MSYSERAERALKRGAPPADIPADLTDRIMRAVRHAPPPRALNFVPRRVLGWVAGIAACFVLAIGLRMTALRPTAQDPPEERLPGAAIASFSEFDPAGLVSAAAVSQELDHLRSDVAHALAYVLTPPHPPADPK